MWNFIIMFFILNLTTIASVLSQHHVTLEIKNANLKHCIKVIEKETGMGFLYNGKELQEVKGISLSV